MRKIVLLIILISQLSFGQDGTQGTFSMAVVKPNKAEIEKSLEKFTDSIELTYRNQYYTYRNRLIEMQDEKPEDYPEDMRADFKESKKQAVLELKQLDSLENQILNYKYYELISYYTTTILNMSFNEYEPYSSIFEVQNSEIKNSELSEYAEIKKVDFVLLFENIKVTNVEGVYKMTSQLKLYSKKENKFVLEKNILGNTNSYGGMWTCGNSLSCLFITSIKNSMEFLIPAIRQRI
tara:strand:- start:890 stop:1597 length:708 start_codon:yes stop_codon:yes gene_type:complete